MLYGCAIGGRIREIIYLTWRERRWETKKDEGGEGEKRMREKEEEGEGDTSLRGHRLFNRVNTPDHSNFNARPVRKSFLCRACNLACLSTWKLERDVAQATIYSNTLNVYRSRDWSLWLINGIIFVDRSSRTDGLSLLIESLLPELTLLMEQAAANFVRSLYNSFFKSRSVWTSNRITRIRKSFIWNAWLVRFDDSIYIYMCIQHDLQLTFLEL